MIIDTSVVICAYTEKRWDSTLAAIDSVQAAGSLPLETVLVVDHNTDLFRRFSAHFEKDSNVTVIENSHLQGLSGARNTGIAAANGDYIGFLDDDAVAEPDWLDRLTSWCKEPNVIGAGGWVNPVWVGDKPAWFPPEFYWIVGCSYEGMPATVTSIRNPFGGSMVVRREIFENVGGFRTGTGRVGEVPLGCEETELCIRARQQQPDAKFVFDPAAVIWHLVPDTRTTWSYYSARCYNEGLSKALLSRLVGAGDGLSSERSYTFRVLPRGVLRGLRDTLFRFDFNGLLRAGAIVAGLLITTVGYGVGLTTITRRSAQRKAVAGIIPSGQSQ